MATKDDPRGDAASLCHHEVQSRFLHAGNSDSLPRPREIAPETLATLEASKDGRQRMFEFLKRVMPKG